MQFQEYLSNEVKDVADFKIFLAQLRETIQKRQARENNKKLVQQLQVDKMAEERNKNAYVSENFFIPNNSNKPRHQQQQQQRRPKNQTPNE